MPGIECFHPRGQMFTHVDSKTGVNTCFAVTDLRRWCDANRYPLSWLEIQESDMRLMLKHRGIENHRLHRALASKRWLPLLVAHMPDATQLVIDGSHTVCARYIRNERTASAYIIPQEVWCYFTIDDMPQCTVEELAKSFSGVY